MIVGYGRTSTAEQVAGLEAQIRDLTEAGAERIFTERVSSVSDRAQLNAALDFVRSGDTLVCCKLDRLARSTADLLAIVSRLETKGVALRVMAMSGGEPLDTRTATGKLMLTVLGAVAEFERSLMLERQKEGIAKAQLAGLYKGRHPSARLQADAIRALAATGLKPTAIAKELGIGRSSVYRVLEEPPPD